VDAVKLSLHLNIAMCWLKITDATNNLEQAIRSCDDALAIDADSVKALFRRATAREQKGLYDEAKEDLKRAGELAPDDKAVVKLLTRVDAQIARQKAKEKKMYGKMFG
jgi:tetratricopeptide (TPR) repeat protein